MRILGMDLRSTAAPIPYRIPLEIPKHKRAFTLAHFGRLPSAILAGCYKKMPFAPVAQAKLKVLPVFC